MPLESEPKPVCIKVHINSSYPQPLALKTSHKCSLDFLFLQARTELSEISQIFLQLSTYKALNLSHNQKNPKKHKPKRNPNKLTHKEIKIWLYKIAAIFFFSGLQSQILWGKKTNALSANYKTPKNLHPFTLCNQNQYKSDRHK